MITASNRFMKRYVTMTVKDTQYSTGTMIEGSQGNGAQEFGVLMRHLLIKMDQVSPSAVSYRCCGVHHSPLRKWSSSDIARSCMISFQASPVEARTRVRKAQKKLWKEPPMAWSSDCLEVAKRATPRIPYIVSNNRNTAMTFANFGSVSINAWNSLWSSLEMVTRRTHRQMRIRLPSMEPPALLPQKAPPSMPTPVTMMQAKSKTFMLSLQ
mmetsp:Transcript_124915/g.388868  ORF Transcript_124915/g.388868 Transcript_124915/m.388868 type:complete len:211 (-) Transcript_124915:1-633(-)